MDWVAITCGSAGFYAACRWLHGRLHARKGSAGLRKGDRRGIPLKAVVANCEAKWFLQELQQAMSGDHAAMVRVSHMLLVGYGTRQDEAAAATWMRKAWALQNFKEPADSYLQYEMLDFQNSDIPVLNDPLQQPAAAASPTHASAAAAAVASLQRQRQRRHHGRQSSSAQADEATTAAARAAAELGGVPQPTPQTAQLDGGYSSSSSSGSSGVQAGSRAAAAGAAQSSSASSLAGSRGSRQAALHTLTPAAASASLTTHHQQQQSHQQQQQQQQPLPAHAAADKAQQQQQQQQATLACDRITQHAVDCVQAATQRHCTAGSMTTAQSNGRQQQQQEHHLLLPHTLQWQVQQVQLHSQVPVAAVAGLEEDAHCRLEHCYPQAC